VFVTAYINNILIYLSLLSKHQKHIKIVLKCLQDAGLQCNIKKCKFHMFKVIYLGLIISYNRIKIDPKKVTAIINWESPNNIQDI